jgi:hypothetical protein
LAKSVSVSFHTSSTMLGADPTNSMMPANCATAPQSVSAREAHVANDGDAIAQ